jgi:Spy/CpxP family protein refolding chaperone
MNKTIREYFAKIGSKGGKKSKRAITPEQQAKMQSARKKRRATRRIKKDV